MGLSVEANTSHLSRLLLEVDIPFFKISAGSTSKPSKSILPNRYFAFYRSVISKMISVFVSPWHWPKLVRCNMSWEILSNNSSVISILNSPCHGLASLGLVCSRRITLRCIFLRDLATILLDGINLCTFENLPSRSPYFLFNTATASSNSLKTLLTRPISSPFLALFKISRLQR